MNYIKLNLNELIEFAKIIPHRWMQIDRSLNGKNDFYIMIENDHKFFTFVGRMEEKQQQFISFDEWKLLRALNVKNM